VARQTTISTSKVVVATRDLELGTRLRPELLQVVDWPAGLALSDPFSDPKLVYDRVLNTPVLRNEPVVATKLAPPGEQGGLSAVLREGERAITVKVNEIGGVAGFARPGNYVDVMVNTSDEANHSTSKIVLERILVLAVAQDLSTTDTKARVVNAVTLKVTPEEAERIDLARSIGSLSLVLRNQVDKGRTETSGAHRTDLLKAPPPAVVPAPEKKLEAPAVVAPKPAPAVVRRSTGAAAPERLEVIRGLTKSLE
jgi:pilus assembly protein CpaB